MRIISVYMIFLLAGCAAAPVALLPVAAPVVIAGASGGISYTFTNIAVKTTPFPMEDVVEGNLKALEKLSIKVVSKKKEKYTAKVKCRTRDLVIYITFRSITPALTQMRVNAKRGFILKDKGTAFEIVLQTEKYLLGAEPDFGPALTRMEGPGELNQLNAT